jgi:hypothetical protein
MAYSDFTLDQALDQFELREQSVDLFDQVQPIAISDWLKEALSRGQKLALLSSTEKARSEFIVVPILIELQRRNPNLMGIYSGKQFNVDSSRGLDGESDFVLSKGLMSRVIQAPVFSLVQAKRQDLEVGLGQCTAQMIAIQIFNQKKHQSLDTIFGCVTTAENWLFLKLKDTNLSIEPRIYYLNELEKIVGILQAIYDHYS